MDCSVFYGKHVIDFSVERKDRKTIKISVYPDLSVKVVAPIKASMDKILEKVHKKAGWIKKNVERFKSLPPRMPKREYVSGETFIYLGRQYCLKVFKGASDSLKMKGAFLNLMVSDKSKFKLKEEIVLSWYKEKAIGRYTEIMNKCLKKVEKQGINRPKLTVKTLKSRWGSCSTKTNTVLLNTELIKAPSHCVEYVIMHELCHLKYTHHDKRFYRFLTQVLPDWKKRKKRLVKVVF